MAYVFYNPNPRNKRTSDCVVRAVCCVLDMDWEQAYVNLFSKGLELCEMPDTGRVLKALLNENGFRSHIAPDCPDCYTVADFAYDHPEGRYVAAINGNTNHVVGVVDGNWYDTWDSGEEIISFYMRKER